MVCANGSQFVSHEFQHFLKEFSVKFWPISRYHFQANAAEAANKILETYLRAYVKDNSDHQAWVRYLCEVTCALNSSIQKEDPENKFNPIHKIVKENLLKAYQKSKQRYDLRSRPVEFEVGDTVFKVNQGNQMQKNT